VCCSRRWVARAEQWLEAIKNEIEDKLIASNRREPPVEYWLSEIYGPPVILFVLRPLKDHLGSGVAAVSRWLQTAPSRCS
jgi:hypothetical protein